MDAVTKAVIKTLRAAGIALTNELTPDGQHRVMAIDPDTGETHIVTDPDLYAAVCEAGEAAGFELDDDAPA